MIGLVINFATFHSTFIVIKSHHSIDSSQLDFRILITTKFSVILLYVSIKIRKLHHFSFKLIIDLLTFKHFFSVSSDLSSFGFSIAINFTETQSQVHVWCLSQLNKLFFDWTNLTLRIMFLHFANNFIKFLVWFKYSFIANFYNLIERFNSVIQGFRTLFIKHLNWNYFNFISLVAIVNLIAIGHTMFNSAYYL